MDYRKQRIGRLTGCAAVALAAFAVPAAHAQQAQTPAPAPAPAPAPSPTRSAPPNVMYLPNVVPERFSIGGSPTPAPAPPPVVVPTPVPTPAPAARSGPAADRATRPARTVETTPAATPTPATSPPPAAGQIVTSQPVATPQPQVVSAPAPTDLPAAGTPGWIWALGGAAGMALLLGGGWALRRRRRQDEDARAFEPVVEPVPVPQPPPRAVPPGLTPRPEPVQPRRAASPQPPRAAPPVVAGTADPFEIALRPVRIDVGEQDIVLELELLVGNRQAAAAEALRASLALMSANPDQDRQIAGFHANPMVDTAGQPFDLPAGGGGRMPARLRVRRENLHVVQVGGRPMFVPIVMVDLRWRGGLSIRRFGADFMVGTAGQGPKLGPIWLDRAALAAPLAATRYVPRPAPVAA